jgi:hypothetical protein
MADGVDDCGGVGLDGEFAVSGQGTDGLMLPIIPGFFSERPLSHPPLTFIYVCSLVFIYLSGCWVLGICSLSLFEPPRFQGPGHSDVRLQGATVTRLPFE